MRNLVEGMVKLRDRLSLMANSFDLFENETLILVTRTALGETCEQILPNPSIRRTTPQLATYIERVQGVRVEVDSFQVSGISKLYKEEDLLRRGTYYVIGGSIVDGKLFGGVVCDRYPNVDLVESAMTWTIVLKERQM